MIVVRYKRTLAALQRFGFSAPIALQIVQEALRPDKDRAMCVIRMACNTRRMARRARSK